jgi:hypothetical protein
MCIHLVLSSVFPGLYPEYSKLRPSIISGYNFCALKKSLNKSTFILLYCISNSSGVSSVTVVKSMVVRISAPLIPL